MPLSYINIDELKTARIVYRQPLRWYWLWRQQIIIASCHIVVWKLFHILISLKSHLSLNTLVFVQFWKCFGHFFFFFFQNGCQNGNCHFGNLSFEFSVKLIASLFVKSAIFFLDSKVKSSVQEYWLFIVSFRGNCHKFISS